jgi:hypothetical protein
MDSYHVTAYGYVQTMTDDLKHILEMIKSKIKDLKNKKIEIVKIIRGVDK